MEKLCVAVGVEGGSVIDCLEVHGNGGATTDQGRAGGTRELSGAEGMTVPGGAKGARWN